MNINLLGGELTQKLQELLETQQGFSIIPYTNISEGLKEVYYSDNLDMLLIYETALINESGRQYVLSEVFNSLTKIADKFDKCEVLLITTKEDVFNTFSECCINCLNCRAELIPKLTSRILIDCVLNRYRQEEVEDVNEEEIQLESVPEEEQVTESNGEVQESHVRVVEEIVQRESKPEPQPEPQPEPPRRPKKENKRYLSSVIDGNKVIIVTGNPNSGVTGLACDIANVLASEKISTLLIDLDIYSKGVNKYYPELDDARTIQALRVGLMSALEDIREICNSKITIKNNLDILGVTSEVSCKKLESYMKGRALGDLVSAASVDYKLVVVHIPVQMLLEYDELSRYADYIVYCANPTLNGVYGVDRYMNTNNYGTMAKVTTLRVIHRKLRYVLTNVRKKHCINNVKFIESVVNMTQEIGLENQVLGSLPEVEAYDKFDDVSQYMMSKEKEWYNLILDCLFNLF